MRRGGYGTEAGGAGLAAAEVKLRDYRFHSSPSPVPSREAAEELTKSNGISTLSWRNVTLVPQSQPKAYTEFPSGSVVSIITYHSLR